MENILEYERVTEAFEKGMGYMVLKEPGMNIVYLKRKGKPAVATKKEIWYVPFDYNEPQKPLMLIADSGKKVYGHE